MAAEKPQGGLELEFTWRRPSGIIQLKGVVYYILSIIFIWRWSYKQGAYSSCLGAGRVQEEAGVGAARAAAAGRPGGGQSGYAAGPGGEVHVDLRLPTGEGGLPQGYPPVLLFSWRHIIIFLISVCRSGSGILDHISQSFVSIFWVKNTLIHLDLRLPTGEGGLP